MIDAECLKERICEAQGYDGEGWLERALNTLARAKRAADSRRVVDVSTVGKRIRWARESVGMSQEQLGRRLGISGSELGAIERGEAGLHVRLVRIIANQTKVKPEWLIMASDEGGPDVPGVRMSKHISREVVEWRKKQREFRERKQREKVEKLLKGARCV